jgi:hypothetical protein
MSSVIPPGVGRHLIDVVPLHVEVIPRWAEDYRAMGQQKVGMYPRSPWGAGC